MKTCSKYNRMGIWTAWCMSFLVVAGIQRVDGSSNFGASVAVGNFNGVSEQTYSTDEIVVGNSYEGNGFIYVYVKDSSGNWVVFRKAADSFGGTTNGFGGFGYSFAVGDFNGDGKVDLAVGCPNETVDGQGNAGAVYILYGANNGSGQWPFGSYRRITADDAFSVPISGPQPNAAFGASLAAGDFNGDGVADLAVGAPNTPTSVTFAGAVYVFHRLTPTGSLGVAEYTYYPGGPYGPNVGTAGVGYNFGLTLAAGNFNGIYHGTFTNGGHGGTADMDLAVGTPYDKVNSVANAGSVTVMYGGLDHLNDSFAQAPQLWTENNTGGTAKANELFGSSIVGGSFSRNINLWYDWLAIGIPNATVNNLAHAGEVRVLKGSSSGLTGSGSQLYYPGATVAGHVFASGVAPQANGYFGTALAAGDVFNEANGMCQGSGCEPQELIIGEPNRNVSPWLNSGSIYIVDGQAITGLNPVYNEPIPYNHTGNNIYFGQALASGQVGLYTNQDITVAPNAHDIIVGAPGINQWNIYYGDRTTVNGTVPYTRNYY